MISLSIFFCDGIYDTTSFIYMISIVNFFYKNILQHNYTSYNTHTYCAVMRPSYYHVMTSAWLILIQYMKIKIRAECNRDLYYHDYVVLWFYRGVCTCTSFWCWYCNIRGKIDQILLIYILLIHQKVIKSRVNSYAGKTHFFLSFHEERFPQSWSVSQAYNLV